MKLHCIQPHVLSCSYNRVATNRFESETVYRNGTVLPSFSLQLCITMAIYKLQPVRERRHACRSEGTTGQKEEEGKNNVIPRRLDETGPS